MALSKTYDHYFSNRNLHPKPNRLLANDVRRAAIWYRRSAVVAQKDEKEMIHKAPSFGWCFPKGATMLKFILSLFRRKISLSEEVKL